MSYLISDMNDAKIRFSQKEMDLITNADWILTKNSILKKIDYFLSEFQVKQKIYLSKFETTLPIEITQSSPKISKGEYYNGLPYRMLDYPKIFNRSEIFAIRTMFWWGNFFSITIHLSGKYKTLNEKKIIEAWSSLKENGMYCCINEDQWEHHFELSNYISIATLSETAFQQQITKNSFCKLAFRIPLMELGETENLLFPYFQKIIELVTDQAPRR